MLVVDDSIQKKFTLAVYFYLKKNTLAVDDSIPNK